jgi:hypothetical protein
VIELPDLLLGLLVLAHAEPEGPVLFLGKLFLLASLALLLLQSQFLFGGTVLNGKFVDLEFHAKI